MASIKMSGGSNIPRVYSLEQLLSTYRNRRKPRKMVYFIEKSGGKYKFGIAGSSYTFYAPESLYRAVGNPTIDDEVPMSTILEKAKEILK